MYTSVIKHFVKDSKTNFVQKYRLFLINSDEAVSYLLAKNT